MLLPVLKCLFRSSSVRRRRKVRSPAEPAELLEVRQLLAVFSSSDVPKSIRDFSWVRSAVEVPATSFRVENVRVSVDIDHTYVGDVDIFLRAPDGETVVLLSGQNGGSSNDFDQVTFDGSAVASIASAPTPFSGAYRPVDSLDVLRGINPAGTWTLMVYDGGGGDIGTLNSWSIDIQTNGLELRDVSYTGPVSRNTPLESATIRFTESIDASTLTFADLELQRNGTSIPLNSGISITESVDAGVYQVSGLGAFASGLGDYTLTVSGRSVLGLNGTPVFGTSRAAWSYEGATLLGIVPVTPDVRNSSVDEVDFRFSFPVNLETMSGRHFRLYRNDVLVPLDDSVTVAAVGQTGRYRISGLNPFTRLQGSYVLTVLSNGITDEQGLPASGIASDNWVISGPRVQRIVPISPDPRNSAVDSVGVVFQFHPDLATFDFNDIQLRRDSQDLPLNSGVTVARVGSTSTYRISGLTAFTNQAGYYSIRVLGRGIRDAGGRVGEGDQWASWSLEGPAATRIDLTGATVRSTPLDSLEVHFAFPIDPDSFTFEDLTLRRLETIPLSNSVSITRVGTTNRYLVTGLAPFAALDGSYTLTVNNRGVSDLEGRSGRSSGTTSNPWTLDRVAPQLVDVVDVSPNPRVDRGKAVSFIRVDFSEPLQTNSFTWRNVTLQRNGGPNLITDRVRLSNWFGGIYSIGNLSELTSESGVYTLTVSGNFLDAAGNSGSGSITETWVAGDTPILRMSGQMVYPEDSRPLIISGVVRITDPDTTTYGGGSLTVSIVQNLSANDRLAISNWGHSEYHVGVDGNQIRHRGQSIGTFSGGSGTPLVVSLNALATTAAVEALMSSINFVSPGEYLNFSSRIVRFALTDEHGITGQTLKRILITPVDDASQLQIPGVMTYARNSAPKHMALGAVLTDVDTTFFNNRLLRVQVTGGADGREQLRVSGAFTIVGAELRLNDVVIGRVHGDGIGRQPLILRLGRNVSQSIAQRLIRSLTFSTAGSSSSATRGIEFSIGASGGVTSEIQRLTVDVN